MSSPFVFWWHCDCLALKFHIQFVVIKCQVDTSLGLSKVYGVALFIFDIKFFYVNLNCYSIIYIFVW